MSQTYREQFDSAMKCSTREEAEVWMRREVARYRDDFGQDEVAALVTIQSNLGYMAGYCDHATAQKVQQLFGALHPIFGTSTYHEDMTENQVFKAGVANAEAMRSAAIEAAED